MRSVSHERGMQKHVHIRSEGHWAACEGLATSYDVSVYAQSSMFLSLTRVSVQGIWAEGEAILKSQNVTITESYGQVILSGANQLHCTHSVNIERREFLLFVTDHVTLYTLYRLPYLPQTNYSTNVYSSCVFKLFQIVYALITN